MTMPVEPQWALPPGESPSKTRASEALAYWRASRRLVRNDRRLGLSPARADVVLINQALGSSWPRLKAAAVATFARTRTAHRKRKMP